MLKYYDLNTLQTIEEQEWIIENFLPSKSIIILYGTPGSCKTFVALDISLLIFLCFELDQSLSYSKNGIVCIAHV